MSLRSLARNLLGRAEPRPSAVGARFDRDLMLVHEDEHLRITSLGDPAASNIVLCFTGIQQGMGGVGAEEFVGSARMPGHSALFISDRKRSWFNDFEPEHLLAAIRPRTEGRRIVALGNSMGGFGAIWISAHLPAECVVAFAPQFSVKPDIVPGQQRWQEYRAAIRQWRVPSLASCFRPTTRYYTINGDADAIHFAQFPREANLHHYLVPNSGHNPAKVLKEGGVLGETFRLCAAGQDPAETIRAAGIDLRLIGDAA